MKLFTKELFSMLLNSGTTLYRYDLRPYFTVGIILIECVIILLALKPKKKVPFILTILVFNYIALYMPLHMFSYPAPDPEFLR